MKVRELMKELIDLDPDTEIKILMNPFSVPDGKRYFANISIDDVDYDPNDFYYIFISSQEFKSEDGTLLNLLRQCKTSGDGVTEFPDYLKMYDEEIKK